jgi:hypothetical protein
MKGVDGAGWSNGRGRKGGQYRATKGRGRRRVTELADQKEMIADNDRSVEHWTFIHFAEQNEAVLESSGGVDVESPAELEPKFKRHQKGTAEKVDAGCKLDWRGSLQVVRKSGYLSRR